MRKTLLAVPLAALLASCGLDNVDVNARAEQTIPGGPGVGGTLTLSFADLAGIDIREELRRNDASLDDIDSAKLQSLVLNVLDGASFDTFLQSVEFFVSGEGLPDEVVARATGPFPAGARSIPCQVRGVELKPYARSGVLSIGTRVTGSPPSEDTRVEARAVLSVDVDVSNFIGL